MNNVAIDCQLLTGYFVGPYEKRTQNIKQANNKNLKITWTKVLRVLHLCLILGQETNKASQILNYRC